MDDAMPFLPTLNAPFVRKAVLTLAVADCALVMLGLILTPTTLTASRQGWLGVTAAFAMLSTYAALGVWGSRAVERKNPRILSIAVRFGLAIGSIFVVEMLAEYALLPSSKGNERLAYLEFGGMFLCLFLAGLKGG